MMCRVISELLLASSAGISAAGRSATKTARRNERNSSHVMRDVVDRYC